MLRIRALLEGRSWVFIWELIDCLEVIKNDKIYWTHTQSIPLTSWCDATVRRFRSPRGVLLVVRASRTSQLLIYFFEKLEQVRGQQYHL